MTPPPSPVGPAPARPPVLPLVLLGLMTLATFAGPFLIAMVLVGGDSRGWPPDRPVEWVTVVGVCGLYVALMGACLTAGLWSRPRGGGRADRTTDEHNKKT